MAVTGYEAESCSFEYTFDEGRVAEAVFVAFPDRYRCRAVRRSDRRCQLQIPDEGARARLA